MSRTLLTEEVRAHLGREVTYIAPEPLSGAAFRYFALAIGDDNPRWRQGVAPPTFICESVQYLDSRVDLRRGGHHWDLPVSDCRELRGGHEYEFFRPVREGDHVSVTWRLTDLAERRSAGGKAMLIVTSEATYRTIAGEPLAVNRETLIYMER
ncbi:MAG TPA: MaoC family dehydratase N-terminal domain-containing protein [Candidatus Dormibacteraeota bacterium]|nr:MaoC family dehydratase N-terminal domain-containing protein [Candidatus Dormibacteraeota bacterium]